MAKQIINIGTVANDGTGTNLRSGGSIINDNFNEIYNAIGNGTSITLTATPTELNLLSGQTSLVTATSSTALTNKNLTSLTNTFPTISIRDDASSSISLSLGGTLKFKSNDGITTTVSQGDTITISLDSNVLTETSSDVLTNKTIAAASNTITGLTNTNLSGSAGITNANIANSFIRISDESSTQGTIPLGGRIEFTAGEAINTTIENGNRVLIAAEDATSSNKGVATFNTASFTVTSGDVTIKSAGVSNAQLANSTITLGSTSTSLGATTTSVAGLSLTGSANTIDLTSSGNKLKFNYVNFAGLPNNTTYAGMFATTTGTAKAYFADSGAWNEILSENSSIKDLSDVAGTNPTNGQILIFNSTSGRYEPNNPTSGGTVTSITAGTGLSGGTITTSGTISITNPNIKFADSSSTVSTINLGNTLSILGGNGITTSLNGGELTITRTSLSYSTGNFTGDGSTINFTINSGRAVDNVFVIVNGLILVPTTDYTISGTTLSFVEAPTASAEIQVRYLPL